MSRASRGDRLEARLSIGRFLYFSGGALLCWSIVLLSVVLLVAGDGRSPAIWLGLLMFGAFGVVISMAAFALRPTRPMLVLDVDGLRHPLVGHVRWSDVAGIALDPRSLQGKPTTLLAIALEPGAMPTGGWRAREHLQPAGRVDIAVDGLNRTPEAILATARKLRDRVLPLRIFDWKPSMGPEVVAALRKAEPVIHAGVAEMLKAAPGEERTAAERRLNETVAELTLVAKASADSERRDRLRRNRVWVWILLGLTVLYGLFKLLRFVV